VTNRGLAHRPAFESRADVRAFLALLAHRVHEGQLEVHAFSILTTHFHLLLRSPRGELSNAMMWIENQYVKYFNRLRGRDGSLFRSRFRSRIVDTQEYWFNVVRYIDANPIEAKLCSRAAEFEFGSARMYCGSRSAPWLERASVEGVVKRLARARTFQAADYERLFGSRLDPDETWILERRIARGSPNRGGEERGNELLQAASGHVLDWLRSRAQLADGSSIGLTLAAPGQIERQVQRISAVDPHWRCLKGPQSASAWRTLELGLLRQLCGMSLQEIAVRKELSRTAVWVHDSRHAKCLEKDALYIERVSNVVEAVRRENTPSALCRSGQLDVDLGLERVSGG